MLQVPVVSWADDASTALLAKHRAYVGWQFGDGSIMSLTLDGTHTYSQNGTTRNKAIHEIRSGIAWRRTSHDLANGLDTNTGFTGRIYWSTNVNGFIAPELGDLQKFDIAHDLVFNEATTTLPGTIQGTKTLNGTAYTIVRVAPAFADTIDLYVEPATGAYKRVVIDPGGTYETTINVLGYIAAAPGKRIIGEWKYANATSDHFMYTKAIANTPIDITALHPPPQTARWNFASGKPFPITFVDSDTDYDHAVYVDAIVNGVKGHFLMDTGAADILLDQDFANRAHVKEIDTANGYGIGGIVHTRVDRVDTFNIGGNVLSNLVVASASEGFRNFDGLIGFDLFAGALVNVDMDNKQMTLYDPKTVQADTSRGIVATVDLSQMVPRIPMKVNGNINVTAFLDSGDGGDIDISLDLVTRHGLRMLVDNSLIGYLQSHKAFSGVGGIEVDTCGRLDSVTVGPIQYTQAPACESPSFAGEQILVGFDFLKNFNLLFDYPEAKLILIPRKSAG